VRIAVAFSLLNEHGFRQADVAHALGIAQAEVSKYLNGRYSAKVARLRVAVERSGIHLRIVRLAISGKGVVEISKRIEEAASSGKLVGMATKR
jgi:predicted transcriptional regulator